MRRRTLVTALSLLVAQPCAAAEKIYLSCSGEMLVPPLRSPPTVHPASVSLVIDLDQKTVTGSLGRFRISKVSDSRIDFTREEQNVFGHVDRVTGESVISFWGETLENLKSNYNLKCKSVKPAF